MRILLDHCVDWRLARSLPAHDVKNARETGWQALKKRLKPGRLCFVAFHLLHWTAAAEAAPTS